MMDENTPTLTELQGKVNQLEVAVSQQLSPPSIPSPTPLESALKEKLGGESIWHWLWYLLTPFLQWLLHDWSHSLTLFRAQQHP